jgi:hypothetical protein
LSWAPIITPVGTANHWMLIERGEVRMFKMHHRTLIHTLQQCVQYVVIKEKPHHLSTIPELHWSKWYQDVQFMLFSHTWYRSHDRCQYCGNIWIVNKMDCYYGIGLEWQQNIH